MSEDGIEDSLLAFVECKEGLRGFSFELGFKEPYKVHASDRVLGKRILRVLCLCPRQQR